MAHYICHDGSRVETTAHSDRPHRGVVNINQGVGSTDTSTLSRLVQDQDVDLGIAFDGDGDRVLFVDADGSLWTATS